MSGNPYKAPLRNANKKLAAILELEEKQAQGIELTPAQVQKVAGGKKLVADIKDLEHKSAVWDAGHSYEPEPEPSKPEPVQKPKKEKKEKQPKEEAQAQPEAEAPIEAVKSAPAPKQEKAPKPKQEKKKAPASQEQELEIDDSCNPYKKTVRNLKKKADDILALEAKVNSGEELNPEQKKKLASKGSAMKSLKDAEAQAKAWNEEQVQLLHEILNPPPVVEAPKKATPEEFSQPKSQKKAEAQKKAESQKKGESQKKAAPAAPAADKPKKEKAPKAPKGSKASPASAIDFDAPIPGELKPYRNKVRNLQKKVTEVENLKAKPANSLTPEQVAKIKNEEAISQELSDAEVMFLSRLASS